jgi:hypothetical protein
MSEQNKQEIICDLIEELLLQGMDEDSHFRFYSYLDSSLSIQDISDTINNIEKMDLLMFKLRPIIIDILKEVKEDYEEEE